MSDWLLDELRVSGPPPSDELRERVRALAAPRSPAGGQRRWLLLVPAMAVAASVGVAAVSVLGPASAPPRSHAGEAVRGAAWVTSTVSASAYDAQQLTQSRASAGGASGAPVPSAERAQRYRADIVVHVADNGELGRSAARAMQLTRDLGGYLVSASQETSVDGTGRSALVVRVPTARVQRAIVRFAQLGTILRQDVQVQDLQQQLDTLFRQAQGLRARITELEGQPASAKREAKLRALRLRLDELTGRGASVKRSARYARVALTLTTADDATVVPPPHRPGRLERAWHRAVDVLAQELVIVLYAAVVAGPLALLALLAWIAARGGRRRSREALLERS